MPAHDTPTSTVLYRERLWPSAWLWFLVLLISAMTILVAYPISPVAAAVVFFVVLALLAAWLVSLSTTVAVTADRFVVGRASIERRFLGEAVALEGDDATHAKGPGLDARAYLHLRLWLKDVVRVQIDDPDDPTPAWLISTRHPRELAAALTR